MMDVFFYEAFEEECDALKRYLGDAVEAKFTWKTIQEHDSSKPPAPLISVRTQSTIPLGWVAQLSGIITRSTGYDHLTAYLQRVGTPLPCGNLPQYCSRSVAEQAMLMWMALLRKLPQQIFQFKNFNRDGITGTECLNKNLLIIGVGNIGKEVADIGQALGMNVRGVDIDQKQDTIEYISLEEGLVTADIMVCAMNLTGENKGLLNYHCLKQSMSDLVFINISRGECSPMNDLLRLLKENRLGAVGLDVFNHEKELGDALRGHRESSDREVRATQELAKLPNVILTPHNAFNTKESVERKASQTAEQIAEFGKSGNFIWKVP